MEFFKFSDRGKDASDIRRFYSVAKISEKISETPEGFLICEGVPITRTGNLSYAPSETPIESGVDGTITITRSIEDILNPETIASFEGKPVTIEHPEDFVTPENWKILAVGVVQNVRAGEGEDADKLLADLLITDAEAIAAVRNKSLREVSCGYEAEYVQVSLGVGRQENIIGNHVALVSSGRCGSECAIFDHAPKRENGEMSKQESKFLKNKLLSVFTKSLDEAMPEEKAKAADEPDVAAMLQSIMARLDKLEGGVSADDDELTPQPVAELDSEEEEIGKTATSMDERLAGIQDMLAKVIESMGTTTGIQKTETGMDEDEEKKESYMDSDTIARAEILAAGIQKTKNIKVRSLQEAYKTPEGKLVIDSLLAGKKFAVADKDMLFVAASEMLKNQRRTQMNVRNAVDNNPKVSSGIMTPEKINAINEARYTTKK